METVSAVQTKDYIVSAIRSEILAGNMRPGEELTQEMIAELLTDVGAALASGDEEALRAAMNRYYGRMADCLLISKEETYE